MSGVIGIYSKDKSNISDLIYYGLYAIQHRGQLSAGVAVNNNGFIDYSKNLGLVSEVFTKEILNRLNGNMGIGHVKYAYSNEEQNILNAHPLVAGYKKGALALTMDGILVNSTKIKDQLEDDGIIFQSGLDGEVIVNLIARNHKGNLEDAIINTLEKIKGSYSLIIMTNEGLFAARDPYGLKPLSLGKVGEDYIISSESCAFDTLDGEFIRDIEAGEIVLINDKGVQTIKKEAGSIKPCLFELIYFARPDSKVDGKSIYLSRIEAGRQLARETENHGDIVVGAPDSGIVFAIGFSEESKIPYAEGFIKNRYVGRSFIQLSEEKRELSVKLKLNAVRENVSNKRVILVDDSIVRGTTIKKTVNMLKKAGAKEIHVRIASPQVINTCHLGMDTPNSGDLISSNMSVEEIRKSIGVDSLNFISLDGLIQSLGGNNQYCMGCFNGQYAIDKEELNVFNL